MFYFFSVLIIIISILLILIVLVQNSKGGGLAAGFSSSNQYMGVRKTADFLEKATWTLAISLVLLCVISSTFVDKGKVAKKARMEEGTSAPAPNPQGPTFPTGGQQTPPANKP